MKKDFDHIAKDYDTDFTHSEIGRRQRASVYAYLDTVFQETHTQSKKILELNCGTGEDAIWLAKKASTVLATDISSEMIKIGIQKAKGIANLTFQQLDVNNLKLKTKQSTFDILFSNFGGLNCLNSQQLHDFFKNASQVIATNGKLILVIMPKNTFWERIYFIAKGKFKTAFRRNTNQSIKVNVANKNVETWYYNPRDIKKMASPFFKIIATKPIGFFIPPSYLEPFFNRYKQLLPILDTLEKRIGTFEFLSRFSDHYLIELEMKKEK